MNRISDVNRGTRAKHHEAQMQLLRTIADLRITLDAGESIGKVQRNQAILTISSVRPDIQHCYEGFEDILKNIAPRNLIEERLTKHMELVSWLTNLNVEMKLIEAGTPTKGATVTVARLNEGERLVIALDSCRERVVFFR